MTSVVAIKRRGLDGQLDELKAIADPRKKELIDKVGFPSLASLSPMNNQMLIIVWRAPEKTAGGVYVPDSVKQEDLYQGITGLVVLKGPTAFLDDEKVTFHGQNVAIGDWVMFRVGETLPLDINKVRCRLIDDVDIRMVIDKPELLY